MLMLLKTDFMWKLKQSDLFHQKKKTIGFFFLVNSNQIVRILIFFCFYNCELYYFFGQAIVNYVFFLVQIVNYV